MVGTVAMVVMMATVTATMDTVMNPETMAMAAIGDHDDHGHAHGDGYKSGSESETCLQRVRLFHAVFNM